MPELSGEKRKKPIALVCTVWGKFIEIFCEYCLPSLLAQDNLPWAATAYDVTLLLYTGEADIAQLQAHASFRRASDLVNVKFVLLETLPAAARDGHWIQWQHATLSADEFSAFILVIPDCVYANSLLQKVLNALEFSDIIYYSLPQVCLELILPQLRRLRNSASGSDSCSALDLSEHQIVDLFLKYINPKHAAAIYKPDYFLTHPEFLIRATKGRLELTEMACHPLALSSRIKALSYTFNPISADVKIGFLEILGISCEFTLKYIEQYFRWSSDRMDLSRYSNLASWYFTFREQGADAYAKTKTDVTLSGFDALSQEQTCVTKPRLVYGNVAAFYHSALLSLYSLAADCHREVRQFIAMAMHLPGFRKAIMQQGLPLTVVLPTSLETVNILNELYKLPRPEPLVKFLLTHAAPGKLLLKVGQRFVLDAAERSRSGLPRLQVVDPALATQLSSSITGTIVSRPVYLAPDIVAYKAKIAYGSADKLAVSLLWRVEAD